MRHTALLASYYLSLWEVLIGLSFLVVGKVIGGYVMKYVFDMVRDDEEKPADREKKSRKPPPVGSRRLLWAGLASLYAVSGLLQIRPALVTVTPAAFSPAVAPLSEGAFVRGVVGSAAHLWFIDPVASNIVSVVLQWSLAILLWLGRERLVGRIGLSLSLAVGILEWIFGEGFGFLASSAGYWTGSPGTGLLYAWGSVLLLLPDGAWRSGMVRRLGMRATAAFFALGAALQVLHIARWGQMAAEIARWNQRLVPLGLLVWPSVMSQAAAHGAVVWFALATVAMLLLALLMWRVKWQAVGTVLSLVAVFVLWAGWRGFGSTVHFALNGGEFPVFAVLLLCVWFAPRGVTAAGRRHFQDSEGEDTTWT